MDIQVLLMDTEHLVGTGRKPQTQALYTNLQAALFEVGFNLAEVKAKHEVYRKEEERREDEALLASVICG
jgi:hypothetical protein